MINFEVEVLTKSGRTYRSFEGVAEEDFKPNTPPTFMKLFANEISFEEAKQDAHFLL